MINKNLFDNESAIFMGAKEIPMIVQLEYLESIMMVRALISQGLDLVQMP